MTTPHQRQSGPARSTAQEFVFVPRPHNVPARALISDLRRVARLLGERTLSQQAYRLHSKYSYTTIFRHFGSWNAGLKRAGLAPSHHRNTPASVVIADLRRVARKLKVTCLSQTQYLAEGTYSAPLIRRRFGSWPVAVIAAGLEPSGFCLPATKPALLENLYQLWRRHGRQPKIVDLVPPYSAFRLFPYQREFGGFENALRALQKWSRHHKASSCGIKHKTPRGINGQLRYQVLKKDNFKCRACGRSPANEPGVRLQVDHIVPWSAGGETVGKNLQTLCQQCNLGKSNR